MQNSIVETLIGAAVIAVAALFLMFAYTSTGSGPVSGYDVIAKFSKADGVNVGTDVRLSGIKVGTVEKLGSMTPEALEALEGIDAEAVNRIQAAINSFYGQEYAEAPQEEEYGEPIVGGNREDAEAAQPVESQAAEEEPAAEENAVAESDEEAAERAASETPPVSSGTMLELAQSITETDTSGRPADETGPEQNPAA